MTIQRNKKRVKEADRWIRAVRCDGKEEEKNGRQRDYIFSLLPRLFEHFPGNLL